MLDRYEIAIMGKLLDILENEDLRKAPAGRIIEIGDQSFSIVAKLYGEEIVLSWHDDKGEAFIAITDWKKRWSTVVDVFTIAIHGVVER